MINFSTLSTSDKITNHVEGEKMHTVENFDEVLMTVLDNNFVRLDKGYGRNVV